MISILKTNKQTLSRSKGGVHVILTHLCVYILDMVEDLLAVIVILVEPGHDLHRSHQVDGAERLA